MVRYYNGEMDAGYIIKDNTILMAPNGYHTNNSAPGITCYFLWFMAGDQRVQTGYASPCCGCLPIRARHGMIAPDKLCAVPKQEAIIP